MKLAKYLEEAKLSPSQFADLIGASKGRTVERYVNGERIPDKSMMVKIALATGCKVTANDFFGITVPQAA